MVQINLSLLFVVASAAIVPTLAHHPLAHALARHVVHEAATDAVGSAFSRRFYGGDSIAFARDVGFDSDLQQREPSWDTVLHPMRSWREYRKKKAIVGAAKAQAEADIKQEHVNGFGRREYFSEAVAERSFDDFDFEARDFEEEY